MASAYAKVLQTKEKSLFSYRCLQSIDCWHKVNIHRKSSDEPSINQ